MRIVAYLAVLLVAAIVLMYVVGRSLPVAHVAARGERFEAVPDSVWRVVTDVAHYPTWRSDIDRVEVLSRDDGRLGWRETSGRDGIEYVAQEMVAPSRFISQIVTKGLGYGGRWIYELTPDAGGTRVTITEEGEVYNPLFRFLLKNVLGETRTIEKFLAALKVRLAR